MELFREKRFKIQLVDVRWAMWMFSRDLCCRILRDFNQLINWFGPAWCGEQMNNTTVCNFLLLVWTKCRKPQMWKWPYRRVPTAPVCASGWDANCTCQRVSCFNGQTPVGYCASSISLLALNTVASKVQLVHFYDGIHITDSCVGAIFSVLIYRSDLNLF